MSRCANWELRAAASCGDDPSTPNELETSPAAFRARFRRRSSFSTSKVSPDSVSSMMSLVPRAEPKSQIFTTRPPIRFCPQSVFALFMSRCITPSSCRYMIALVSCFIRLRTSPARISPLISYKSPPSANSNAMYKSTESGIRVNVYGSITLAPCVAGVWKMSKILMMFGWSRRFKTTTSRNTRFAVSREVRASGTRFSATTRLASVSSALQTAPNDPHPNTETSR
mmetsp:Transcript_11799/g.43868  ORF Transcript_11799/g.43868 Transcript_11799/m.43868 type:complete len:226 (-) Transcript_11799:112-789(-)